MNDAAPYEIVLNDGKFDTENGTGRAGLAAIFAVLRHDRPERLVIHFHGGLISREAGQAAAKVLAPYYRGAGAVPLFVVWESGWLEVIKQQLAAIFNEGIFQRIQRRITQFVRGKLDKELGPGGSKGPGAELSLPLQSTIDDAIDEGRAGQPIFTDLALDQLMPNVVPTPDDAGLSATERQQIQQEIESDYLLQQHLEAITAGRQPASPGTARSAGTTASTLMEPSVLDEIAPIPAPGEAPKSVFSTIMLAKHIARAVGGIVWRVANNRGHGVYLTITEEVLREFYIGAAGKFLWDGMKREIDNAFAASSDCGGTALVEGLRVAWQDGLKPKVTLVGHSAGGIYVARLLRELNAKMPWDFAVDIVLIAPACSFTTLADALQAAGKRVRGMRIFGMGDAIEQQDALVPLLYPASLLYFVAGVLEEESDAPLAGMARYYQLPYTGEKFAAVGTVKAFELLKRQHAFAWSQISGFDGANCDMTSHGGWVHAAGTRDSVMHIVEKGYA
jgi:hypothetical protein